MGSLAPRTSHAAGPMSPRGRVPLLLSGAVLLFQIAPIPSAVRDAATGAWLSGFHFEHPVARLIFTPFCSVADYLTVFSAHQGLVLAGWATFLLIGLGWKRAVIAASIVIVYLAWGLAVPRPMARLVPDDPEMLLLDFHSHTNVSHDGRKTFTAARNMEWHHAQGFSASFITDHNRTEAADQAFALAEHDGPTTAYRSLQGEEVSLYRSHWVTLGTEKRIDNRPFDSDPANIPAFFEEAHRQHDLVIAALPEYWEHHWGPALDDFVRWGVDGFEIVNSVPRSLDFPPSYRAEIVERCRRENLIMTGASDNHGFGYATAAWNAMRLSGWRSMDSSTLQHAVLSELRRKRFEANRVLERPRFVPSNRVQLILSPLFQFVLYWRTLTPLESLAWVAWIWILWPGWLLTGKSGLLGYRRSAL